MSDINSPFDTVLTFGKAEVNSELRKDFYKHSIMSIQSIPEPQINTVQSELKIIPYIKLMTKIQLLASL